VGTITEKRHLRSDGKTYPQGERWEWNKTDHKKKMTGKNRHRLKKEDSPALQNKKNEHQQYKLRVAQREREGKKLSVEEEQLSL